MLEPTEYRGSGFPFFVRQERRRGRFPNFKCGRSFERHSYHLIPCEVDRLTMLTVGLLQTKVLTTQVFTI
jgi:hypothetical protein